MRGRHIESPIGGVVMYKVIEWVEHLDALASWEGSSITGTSEVIQSNGYNQVVKEHQLEKILVWWGIMIINQCLWHEQLKVLEAIM